MILVIAGHDDAGLAPSTAKTVAAAGRLGDGAIVLVAGQDCAAAATQAAGIEGVAKVLLCDAPACSGQLPEVLAPLIAGLAPGFSHIVGVHDACGKNLLPRAAGLLGLPMVSDVVEIEGPDTFVRPTFAGNAIARLKVKARPVVMTIRATAFDPAPAGGRPAAIEEIAAPPSQDRVRVKGFERTSVAGRPELTTARVVVAGGRGVAGRENFRLIEELADRLGAAIGASRAAVDAGYQPNASQIGQTGKVVAPELYIAVGISGAIQHLAGMKDSKVVVAINKDAEAPIFQVADYGLVADLFEAVPDLIKELDKTSA